MQETETSDLLQEAGLHSIPNYGRHKLHTSLSRFLRDSSVKVLLHYYRKKISQWVFKIEIQLQNTKSIFLERDGWDLCDFFKTPFKKLVLKRLVKMKKFQMNRVLRNMHGKQCFLKLKMTALKGKRALKTLLIQAGTP